MKTHIVTKDQLDADNKYIGSVDLTNFKGHLEIEASLGWVVFTSLKVFGCIFAKAGTGIEAGWGIKAGEGISVKLRVFVGLISWRLPSDAEQTVTCKQFSGTLAFGKLAETSKQK